MDDNQRDKLREAIKAEEERHRRACRRTDLMGITRLFVGLAVVAGTVIIMTIYGP